jgi:two-component system response regulator AtoC
MLTSNGFRGGHVLPKTVLVIDDDTTFLRNVCAALQAAGYVALQASDGLSAQRLMDRLQGAFDVAVIDLALPGISGFELIGLLRERAPRVKVIATTGLYRPPYLEIAQEIGAHLALPKPESADTWVGVVQQAFHSANSATQ